MFSSVDNISGLRVHEVLEKRAEKTPPILCAIEACKLCLECKNSILCNCNFPIYHPNRRFRGPGMS